MSDLEPSDIEDLSDIDDSSEKDYDEEDIKPTFTKKKPSLEIDNFNNEDNELDDDTDDDLDDNDDTDIDLNEDDDDDDDDKSIDLELSHDDLIGGTINEESSSKKSKTIKNKKEKTKNPQMMNEELSPLELNIPLTVEKNDSDYESDEDEDEDDDYLQKFDKEIRENYINEQHPEANNFNYDEIYNLAKVQRNKENIISDNLHKTIPILTKYEKTKILGIRAKQLNNGAKPFVNVQKNVIDGYLIALQELEEKKIPIIIRRPLPNGTSEFWHLKDLEII